MTPHLLPLQTHTLLRLAHHFAPEDTPMPQWPALPTPAAEDQSPIARLLRDQNPSHEETLILLMALAPQVAPNFFDAMLSRHLPPGGELPEFGGVRSGNCKGLLPTGETAIFILAGTDVPERLRIQYLLRHSPFFHNEQLLTLEPVRLGEPPMSGRLLLDADIAEWLLTGTVSAPKVSADFPAQPIQTELNWEDLVLHPSTLEKLEEIKSWNKNGHRLLLDPNLRARLRPGYRCLFHGPPGTGKTLTACLLGKDTGLPVYRIDLSMVVSKYIGETEKNLAKIFDKAARRRWILFFDEADALFGKRTETSSAHDRYANQEVSYLLQRIETFDGIAILASNMKKNLDDAFLRRFESVIYFPMPQPEQRLRLWQEAMPVQIPIDPNLRFQDIAKRYEISGGAIQNVVRYAVLRAIEGNEEMVSQAAVLEGIRREMEKEGRSFD